MALNDTFWELKEGIQEALGVQAETLLLMWNDNELLDNQTPDEVGMDCCYFGVENVELYLISNEFELSCSIFQIFQIVLYCWLCVKLPYIYKGKTFFYNNFKFLF